MGVHFDKKLQKDGMLYKSLTFEAVILIITSVNDHNVWYFISLMIKQDIPYPEFTYLLQLMVKTLNESAIYHTKIHTQHEMAPNMFYK